MEFSKKNFAHQESSEDEACLQAQLFLNSYVFPYVLNAAVELDLFGIIARAGPDSKLSASEIASQLPAKNPNISSSLDRMLRLFASNSLLTCSSVRRNGAEVAERLYGLTPAAKYFVRQKDESSLVSLFPLQYHPLGLQAWLHMKDAILEGGSQFDKAHGMSLFKYMDTDPSFGGIFHGAMVARSTILMKRVLEIYKGFEGVKTLVDVGGGTGLALNAIISKYPSIKGINLDLSHAIQTAPSYPGVKQVAGDMFVSIPSADTIMVKDVLHNWEDEECVKILKNCYEALSDENGKVIVMDLLMPETPDTTMSSKFVSEIDNIMLTQPGGRERALTEFEALGKQAGFSKFHVASVVFSAWAMMEFRK
ncbi:hypothetical protein UlMin_034684 [Ulmus minor]